MTTVASPTTTNDGTPTARTLHRVAGHSRLDGVVPAVRGQRSLPTRELRQLDPFVMLDHIGPETLPVDFVAGHFDNVDLASDTDKAVGSTGR
jgi:hypothetical protein